jgi:hypothetical protein
MRPLGGLEPSNNPNEQDARSGEAGGCPCSIADTGLTLGAACVRDGSGNPFAFSAKDYGPVFIKMVSMSATQLQRTARPEGERQKTNVRKGGMSWLPRMGGMGHVPRHDETGKQQRTVEPMRSPYARALAARKPSILQLPRFTDRRPAFHTSHQFALELLFHHTKVRAASTFCKNLPTRKKPPRSLLLFYSQVGKQCDHESVPIFCQSFQ